MKDNSHPQTRIWAWSDITSIWERRFIHRDTAFEIYLTNGKSYFFNLLTERSLNSFLSQIEVHPNTKVNRILNRKTRLQFAEKKRMLWLKGQMTNLGYLLGLNMLSGRSYNETSQYFVFPWVLNHDEREYRGEGRQVYRNFTENVGCQSSDSKREAQKRYALMMEANMQPCHFGSHYSTSGVVSYYLIRLEPFVQAAITLQDGKFDVADRIFSSIEAAWRGCLNNSGDFKELIPEFFLLPEAFVNLNRYSFGVTQSKKRVNKVKLPKWAKIKGENELMSAYNFVRLHEKALESAYVGEKLGQWIDLIFGYKQRNRRAVEAVNQFFPFTYAELFLKVYETAPERDKEGMRQQVVYYGQTPLQLFEHNPHSSRVLGETTLAGSAVTVSRVPFETSTLAQILKVLMHEDKIYVILHTGAVKVLQKPFRTREDTVPTTVEVSEGRKLLALVYPYLLSPNRSTHNSLVAYNLLTETSQPLFPYHSLPLTSLCSSAPYLLQASDDCLLSLWSLTFTAATRTVPAKDSIELVRVYYGHRSGVIDAYMDITTSVIASIDRLGVILLHAWEDASILAAIQREKDLGMRVSISRNRIVAVYTPMEGVVELFTYAGLLLRTYQCSLPDRFSDIIFVKSGEKLLFLGKNIAAWDPFSQQGEEMKLVQAKEVEESEVVTAEYSGLADCLAVYVSSQSVWVLEQPCAASSFLEHLPRSI